MEENSNEGLIEPIGSDWLATDSISLPWGKRKEAESKQTSASGSVSRQLKPVDQILRWFHLMTSWLFTVRRQLQVQREKSHLNT
ncbi:hypothetical protein PAMP_019899 [Pampus punctatissimus]